MPDRFQRFPTQDFQNRAGNRFVGDELTSPAIGTDFIPAFQDARDLAQMLDSGDASFWYANSSTGQGASIYQTTNVPRPQHTPTYSTGYVWSPADIRAPYETATFDDLISPHALSHPLPSAHLGTTPALPLAAPSATPVAPHHDTRRPSDNAAVYNTFVETSPTLYNNPSVEQSQTQGPSCVLPSTLQRYTLTPHRFDHEETASTSAPPQSIQDDDETGSHLDAAETESTEEERNKVARNHPLYQKTPDADGKYHCPQEGQPGCNHKPTTLKCNYESAYSSLHMNSH